MTQNKSTCYASKHSVGFCKMLVDHVLHRTVTVLSSCKAMRATFPSTSVSSAASLRPTSSIDSKRRRTSSTGSARSWHQGAYSCSRHRTRSSRNSHQRLVEDREQLYILGGCPLSGKSSMCMMCLKYRILLLIVIKNPWVILLTYFLLRGATPYPTGAPTAPLRHRALRPFDIPTFSSVSTVCAIYRLI